MSPRRRQRLSRKATAAPPSLAPMTSPTLAVDAEPVGTTALLAKLLPEIYLVAIALAYVLIPRLQTPEMQGALDAAVFFEVVFCMGQGTLIDIATRLSRSPPRWLAIALAAGFGLFVLAYARELLGLVREVGWVMLLGIVWSAFERLREIWTMPNAPRAEKFRRRALVGGRIELVLAFGVLWVLVVVATWADTNGGFQALDGYLAWFVAVYFSLTALDVWRVHRPAFLVRPRSLLRIDPLGIEYLAPL